MRESPDTFQRTRVVEVLLLLFIKEMRGKGREREILLGDGLTKKKDITKGCSLGTHARIDAYRSSNKAPLKERAGLSKLMTLLMINKEKSD